MAPRILIAGGYGIVGSTIARQIRGASKDAALILAGRHPEKADALARELGGTTAVRLDVESAAELPDLASVDLIVSALYDPANILVEAAIRRGIAHIGTRGVPTSRAEGPSVASRQGPSSSPEGRCPGSPLPRASEFASMNRARA